MGRWATSISGESAPLLLLRPNTLRLCSVLFIAVLLLLPRVGLAEALLLHTKGGVRSGRWANRALELARAETKLRQARTAFAQSDFASCVARMRETEKTLRGLIAAPKDLPHAQACLRMAGTLRGGSGTRRRTEPSFPSCCLPARPEPDARIFPPNILSVLPFHRQRASHSVPSPARRRQRVVLEWQPSFIWD